MLSTNRRTFVIALALIAISVPTALAGTQTLTKAQVLKRGSAICHAAERRVEATPGPRSQNPFAKTAPKGDHERALKFMAVYADSLTSVRNGLGKLVPVGPAAGTVAPRLVRLAARPDDRSLPRGTLVRTRAPLPHRPQRCPTRLPPLRPRQREDEGVRLPQGSLPVRIELDVPQGSSRSEVAQSRSTRRRTAATESREPAGLRGTPTTSAPSSCSW